MSTVLTAENPLVGVDFDSYCLHLLVAGHKIHVQYKAFCLILPVFSMSSTMYSVRVKLKSSICILPVYSLNRAYILPSTD
jgi:hypothetical protein